MSTEPRPVDVEYVRLLRVAVDALTTARLYRESTDRTGWRPAYADLIMLDTLTSQTEGEDDWWPRGNADEAMTRIVADGHRVEAVPEGAWEFFDEDVQKGLALVGMLAREDDDVCPACGARFPEGTVEIDDTCPVCAP